MENETISFVYESKALIKSAMTAIQDLQVIWWRNLEDWEEKF